MTLAPVPAIPRPALPPPRRAQRPIEEPLLAYLGSLAPRSRLTVQERLRAVVRLMRVPYEKLVIAVQGYGGRYYEVSPAGLPLLRPYLTDEEY